MLIDKASIGRLIPHAGAMCLLDGVVSWDAARIRCVSASHRAMDNPLRRDGRLGILCGVEYAAQAMAVHGALVRCVDPVRAPVGYLASLRAISCYLDRLDLMSGALFVDAERLYGDSDRAVYRFTLRHEDLVVLEGRAAVAFVVT